MNEMFGLFMLILFIIVWITSQVSENNDIRNKRKDAKQHGKDFYLDRNGSMVDPKSDIPFDYQMINGDRWKVHAYTRAPIENVSAKCRKETDEKERAEAIAKGKTIYPFEGCDKKHEKDEIKGVRYKDLNTGEIYVRRKFGSNSILLNVRTGLLERPDDGYQLICDFPVEYNEYGICTKYLHLEGKEAIEFMNKQHAEHLDKGLTNDKYYNYKCH